jgi:hypothetical protein
VSSKSSPFEQVEKMMKSKLIRAAATLLFVLPFSAFAVPIGDPAGDLLPTFIPGDDPALHGDTDVISSEVSYNPTTNRFNFTGTHAADIGTSKLADGTPGAIYVWGLDRGQGTERLAAIVQDVLFDSVVVLAANGTGFFLDLVTAGATPQAIAGVQISGPTISADVDGALIASLGLFAPEDYTWNLWPRFILVGNPAATDAAVSDFAPNQGNAALTIVGPGAVSEPGVLLSFALGLMLLVFARTTKAKSLLGS